MSPTDLQSLDTGHLDGDVDVDGDVDIDIDLGRIEVSEEWTLPDIYVDIRADLVAPGDGIVTDRHHASAERYEADDPQNQIAGQISPFTLSGWLRHGCERVVQVAGAAACHPGEASADYRRADVYERDLDAGYHEKGACAREHGDDGAADAIAGVDGDRGCVIYELFGGFGDRPGTLLRRPLPFSPIRRQVDVTNGEAEAHYRQLSTQVRSRNSEDGGQPLRHATRDVVGNLVGTWRLTLRDVKPEYVGLLVEAIDYLDAHSDEYDLQLGGARNFGAGMVDCEVLNPLYTAREIRRVYDRGKQATAAMDEKDEVWRADLRQAFVRALQARLGDEAGALGPPYPGEEPAAGGDA